MTIERKTPNMGGGGAYKSSNHLTCKKAFTLAEVLIPKRMRGIINGVSNSRMSEIKEPSRKTKKLCAFTLAEVLITLAIIGVVAALTIPVVVAKYQKQQYYTQFMKVYNTLSDAISLAVSENGNPSGDSDQKLAYFDTYVKPYLKVSKTCDDISDCVSSDIKACYLNHTDKYSNSDCFDYAGDETGFDDGAFFLDDGTFITTVYGGSRGIYINFDTNGPSKGPNVLGRDIFSLGYFYELGNSSKWRLITVDIREYSELSQQELLDEISTYVDMGGYGIPAGCSSDSDSEGGSCATRLLLEGKMNY